MRSAFNHSLDSTEAGFPTILRPPRRALAISADHLRRVFVRQNIRTDIKTNG
jgi:hypothetical protein